MSRLIFEHQTMMKTITYCLMHFIVAISVAYALSGNWGIALSIGIVEPLVQTFCYNFHERGWTKASNRYRQKYIGIMPISSTIT